MNLERRGYDPLTGRDLYSLQVASVEELPDALPSTLGAFVCLLAWNSLHETVKAVSRVADLLLDSGCVYLCSWGLGCERVHDIMDETVVGPDPDPGDDYCVMTTWHDNETLEEALGFFLAWTVPDEAFRNTCRSAVVLSIAGTDDWHETIDRALKSPGPFRQEHGDRVDD